MAENLRSTKYACGTPIPNVKPGSEWDVLSTPAYCYYVNTTNRDRIAKFGALYNWYVGAPDTPYEIAPRGWRMPTDADRIELREYLFGNGYGFDGKNNGYEVAKTLASSTDWYCDEDCRRHNDSIPEGAPGFNPTANNSCGFSGFPAGSRSTFGDFEDIGETGYWWTSSEYHSLLPIGYTIDIGKTELLKSIDFETHGYSIRLVKE